MDLTPAQSEFLATTATAAMITVGRDGLPRVARVGIAVVDGKLWSSGTRDRTRTRRLLADPRCTLFVFDKGYSWLALETSVTVLDGPTVPEQSAHLFRVMQGRESGPLSWFGGELDDEQFLRTMTEEGRIIYEFHIERAYGLV